jgi:succinate dehydrogenase/fumarate reductase flavoprotein subunit
VADVVVIGAGASGLCAAIMARDQGATVIVIEENHDIGGHAMLSGGRVPLGGGTSLQKKHGITDTPDQLYQDSINFRNRGQRYSDRELVRMWADENVPTFDFLIENGVRFIEGLPPEEGARPSRRPAFRAQLPSNDFKQTINGRNGSGVVRPLEASARRKGVTFLLRHKLTTVVRETPSSGRVLGITARFENRDVNVQARKGVVLATGGHTSNINFRRIFDPRLTEEYQVVGEPWSKQTGDGEIAALAVGASLWATGCQTSESGSPISKTRHIGCRYGYTNLKWLPESPLFSQAGGSGLTVENFQDVILVNQIGMRIWNEMDGGYEFHAACLGNNGNSIRGGKMNGGGPIWAIFDADAVTREKWDPRPPNVDPNGYFFTADTIPELARRIRNPYQLQPIAPATLEQTVTRYNSFVDAGRDADFSKPTPMYKVQKPPFYAAWSTPILHDTLTGLRINTKCQVMDVQGQVIQGLYAAGEAAGGFSLHGLPRVTVFGRVAGREAANASS